MILFPVHDLSVGDGLEANNNDLLVGFASAAVLNIAGQVKIRTLLGTQV